MTKALAVAAILGLSVAGANACEFQHTASKTGKMTVASTTATPSMSTPDSKAQADTAASGKVKAAPADKQG